MESKLFILSNGVSTVADLYIAAMCLSKLNVLNSWELYVYCPLCNYLATLKLTKTRKLKVRCNTCSILIFANCLLSQENVKGLRDFGFLRL